VLVVGVIGAALPTMGDAALAGLVGVVVGLVADFFLAGSPRRLEVSRELPDVVVQGEPFDLVRALRAPRALRVELCDQLPPEATADGLGDALVDEVALAPGERVRVSRQMTLYERGAVRFGRVTVRTRGPLGLLRRRMRHAVDTEVRVLPDLARIGAHAERLLRGRDDEGARRRRVIREGREFESLREYQRGDDVRLIEWKASARTGSLIVKRMMPETRQDVVVLLDTGRQLAGRHTPRDGGRPRADVALQAALTLGAAALSKGDRAGMLVFAGDVRGFVPPLAGRGHLLRLAQTAGGQSTVAEEAGYAEAVRFLLSRQKRRAMVVVVTDVTDEPQARALAAAVARLRGRHLPVVVAVSDPDLARLARSDDEDAPAQVRLAAHRLLSHRKKALAALGTAGAVVVDAPGPQASAYAVQAYQGVKATGRL
jgi:uncharacterized protein (DUF58 family)